MSKSKPRKSKPAKDMQDFSAALNDMMDRVYAAMPRPAPKPKPAKSKIKWVNEFEQEWMEADNPAHFHGAMGVTVKMSARRMRLAGVAGIRACGRKLTRVQEAMATAAEQFADGLIGIDALKKAEKATEAGQGEFAIVVSGLGHRQASFALGAPVAATIPDSECEFCHQFINRKLVERCRPVVAVFRDVFGNPFRPVKLDKKWRSETVSALATGIYVERAFDRMPILADALEEAGCDHDEVLAHCRGPGPHVRGCWVVDLVLGKK